MIPNTSHSIFPSIWRVVNSFDIVCSVPIKASSPIMPIGRSTVRLSFSFTFSVAKITESHSLSRFVTKYPFVFRTVESFRISKSTCRLDKYPLAWRGRACHLHRHTADRWSSPSDEWMKIYWSAVAAVAVAVLWTSVLALASLSSSPSYRRTWRRVEWLHECSAASNLLDRTPKSRLPRTRSQLAEEHWFLMISSLIRACNIANKNCFVNTNENVFMKNWLILI